MNRRFWWLGSVALILGLFAGLTEETLEGDVNALDRHILLWVAKGRTPVLNIIALDVTSLGSVTLVVLFSLLGLALLAALRDRRGALQLALAAAGAGGLSLIMKNLFERPRPEVITRLVAVSGFSYPSGHSLESAALYLTIAIIAGGHIGVRARWTLLMAAALIIVLIGASRIYLGVHYPTDVAAGLCLGTAVALLLGGCFAHPPN